MVVLGTRQLRLHEKAAIVVLLVEIFVRLGLLRVVLGQEGVCGGALLLTTHLLKIATTSNAAIATKERSR